MKSFKEYIPEGPNLFNKTISNMKKGSIRGDVAKSLQKNAKQQLKSVGRNDVLLYNKKGHTLMILTKKALERDLQDPDEWVIIECMSDTKRHDGTHHDTL